jgi:hypothetical protein
MAAKPLPAQDVLRQLLRYEPETGYLYWKATTAHPRTPARKPGARAFTCLTERGYYRGGLLGRNVMAHRVVWKWHHGAEPVEIDHINGIGFDNRIENLRSVDRSGNLRNVRRSVKNRSGVTGVYERRGYFIANIHRDGKQVELGYFKTLEEAAACRKAAEAEAGYHPNHGRVVLG